MGSYAIEKKSHGSQAGSIWGESRADLLAHSRQGSMYDLPHMPYQNSPLGPGSTGTPENRSVYGGDARSFYGADARSFMGGDSKSFYDAGARSVYGEPRSRTTSFYAQPLQPTQPPFDPRQSSYSLASHSQFARPGMERASSYGFGEAPPARASMYSVPMQSRPTSTFFPEFGFDTQSLSAPGAPGGVTDAQLEASIRRICKEADLDNITKKGVRRELEAEFGTDLSSRKDTINRIIEAVLAE